MILHIFTYVTAKKLSEAILDLSVKPAVMSPGYRTNRAGAMRRELPNSGFELDFDFQEKFENKGGGSEFCDRTTTPP